MVAPIGTGFNLQQAPQLYSVLHYALWLPSQGQPWNLYYPDYAHELLMTPQPDGTRISDAVLGTLEPYTRLKAEDGLKKGWQDFRQQVTLQGMPFLLCVHISTQTLRLYSERMSDELFYLDLLKRNGQTPAEGFWRHIQEGLAIADKGGPWLYEQACLQAGLEAYNDYDPHDAIEERANSLVQQLLPRMKQYQPDLLEQFSNWGLSLVAEYPVLRIYLLKFVAVLPALEHDKQGIWVKKNLEEALRRTWHTARAAKEQVREDLPKPPGYLPAWLEWLMASLYQVVRIVPAPVVAFTARTSTQMLAKRFIAGESLREAAPALAKLQATGRQATIDPLGELVVSPAEADAYLERVSQIILSFKTQITPGAVNRAGYYKAHVSIKLSALCDDFNPIAPEVTYERMAHRLRALLLLAQQEQVFVNVDAEHYDYRDLSFYVLRRVLLETPELANYNQTGIVLQAYLRDAHEHLNDLIALGKERGQCLRIRLVKGAYWDVETLEAEAHGWNAPQFLNKAETDLMSRHLIRRIIENYPHVSLAYGSHNYSDHAYAEAVRSVLNVDHPPIEHQCLHKTYEALSLAMEQQGWVVRDYVPIGNLLVGMAYLVRRIMENASQTGVLTIMRSHKTRNRLAHPVEAMRKQAAIQSLQQDRTVSDRTSSFANVAPNRLFLAEEAQAFRATEARLLAEQAERGSLESSFPTSGSEVALPNPSQPGALAGKIRFATRHDAERACQLAESNFYAEDGWSQWPTYRRQQVLLRAASLMLVRRNRLARLIMQEAGKTVLEALGDVDEAIDFIRFYCREAERLTREQPGLQGCGPVAVISPWNFPFAIPCGMVLGPLAMGNPVILKSAEQTPLIAERLIQLLHEAGVPKEAAIHLPGEGPEVGQPLLENPAIAAVAFTGSYTVGKHIQAAAGSRLYHNTKTGQTYPVQVIAETGGKNAIVVTPTADPDLATIGILQSAFGHAGQKCSAASRVLVHASIYGVLLQRLRHAFAALQVGPSENWATRINPVIRSEDAKRLRQQAEEATIEAQRYSGRCLLNRSNEAPDSQQVGPVLIELSLEGALKPGSLAQTELFGPVLHVIPYQHFEEAVEVINAVPYGLTGGIYSQSDDEIAWFSERMQVGNLYINRSITGARVSVEPFGGFKASGTGPKAGSAHYLEAFCIHAPQAKQEGLPQLGTVISLPPPPATLPLRAFTFPEWSWGQPNQPPREPELDRAPKDAEAFTLSGMAMQQQRVLLKALAYLPDADRSAELAYARDALASWLELDAPSLIQNGATIRTLPGQKGFMDVLMPQPYTLYLAKQTPPNADLLLELLLALSAGSGCTVFAANAPVADWWHRLRTVLMEAGLAAEQFQVNQAVLTADAPEEAQLATVWQKALAMPHVATVLLEASVNSESTTEQENLQGWLKAAYSVTDATTSLPLPFRRVITPLHRPGNKPMSNRYLHHVRSRAIVNNLLRHGAALDLEQATTNAENF